MTESTVFYCEMCKIKHSRIDPRAQCPTCGRTYCHESLSDMIAVHVKSCPYCPELLKNFTGLSWEIKQSLVPTTEYVAPENRSKVDLLEKSGVITTKKKFVVNEKGEAGEVRVYTPPKIHPVDEAWSNDPNIRGVASKKEEEEKEWIRHETYGPSVIKKKRRSSKRRKRGRKRIVLGMSAQLQGLVVVVGIVLIFVLYPNFYNDLATLWTGPTDNPPIDCKFSFSIRGKPAYGEVNDGWITIYEDHNTAMALETQEIKYGMFTSARYYEPTTLFHIRYARSVFWADQNRTLLLAADFLGSDWPDSPATIDIVPMFLQPLNTTS